MESLQSIDNRDPHRINQDLKLLFPDLIAENEVYTNNCK